MFYALSKTLDLALSPLAWSLVLGLCALWSFGQRRRLAYVLGMMSWTLLYVPSTATCARALWLALESYDAPRARHDVHYDAVVVLGGFAAPAPETMAIEYSAGVDRMFRALDVLRSGSAGKGLIIAGSESAPVEAELIARALHEAGIAEERLILGTKSLNTRQNALEARALAKQHKLKKLVLVTSAFHMQRAYECFRAVGLRPDVLATDFSAPRQGALFEMLAPRAGNLDLSERALREFAGRWVYRVQGFAKRD